MNTISKITGRLAKVYYIFFFPFALYSQCELKPGTNMVLNSEFSIDISNWTLFNTPGLCADSSQSTYTYDNGTLKISINNNYGSCKPYNWRTYLIGAMAGTLVQDKPYVISFKAKTNISTPITFPVVVRNSSNTAWQISLSFWGTPVINVINTWQTFCTVVLQQNPTISNIEIAFFFGEIPDGTEIWIDSVYVGEPAGFVESHIIRTNQLGYIPSFPKHAISVDECTNFYLKDFYTNNIVYTGTCTMLGLYPQQLLPPHICSGALDTLYKLDFTSYSGTGTYYIETDKNYKSYPFNISNKIYDSLKVDAQKFYYIQRCGSATLHQHIGNLSHPACHQQDMTAVVVDTDFVSLGNKNVLGGWHDAGDYVKYITNNALTTFILSLSYLENPTAFTDSTGIPESYNGIPDIVDELAYNATFLLSMQETNINSSDYGGVYSKVSTKKWNMMVPQSELYTRYITPPTTVSTAAFGAAMCYLYKIFNSIPLYKSLGLQCSTAVFRAWSYLQTHIQTTFTDVDSISTANYDQYPDVDERLWFSAVLYNTFNYAPAHNYFIQNYTFCNSAYLDPTYYEISQVSGICPQMAYTQQYAWLGFLEYLKNPYPDPITYHTLYKWLIYHADTIVKRVYNDYFSFHLKTWGNNFQYLNSALLLKCAYHKTQNIQYLHTINEILNYLLGRNITNYSFISSYGSTYPAHLNHLLTRYDAFPDIIPGALVGGPSGSSSGAPSLPKQYNAGDILSLYFDICQMYPKRYLDISHGSIGNEPTIDYNARLIYALYSLNPVIYVSIEELPPPNEEELNYDIFPNPCSSTTTIYFSLPRTEHIKLKVFDILGNEVATVVDGELETGEHTLAFDTSNLSNGVYFYCLSTRGSKQVKHCIVTVMR